MGTIVMRTRPYCLVVFMLITMPFSALTGVSACPLELPKILLNLNGNPLTLEIAETTEARQCGLSLRDALPMEHGMLFIYPEALPLSFWMKDTRIPLSIAFINQEGIIISIQEMKPQQTVDRYRAPSPVQYAIEVNSGWFSRHNIREGDWLDFSSAAGLSSN